MSGRSRCEHVRWRVIPEYNYAECIACELFICCQMNCWCSGFIGYQAPRIRVAIARAWARVPVVLDARLP